MRNHNGVSKDFCEELWFATKYAESHTEYVLRGFNIRNNNLIDDSFEQDLDIMSSDDKEIVAKLEVEVRVSWDSHQFPWPTGSVLTRKDKYINSDVPTFFIGYNKLLTNCYALELNAINLTPDRVAAIKPKHGSIAKEGETRYSIPQDSCHWGIHGLQRFLIKEIMKGRK